MQRWKTSSSVKIHSQAWSSVLLWAPISAMKRDLHQDCLFLPCRSKQNLRNQRTEFLLLSSQRMKNLLETWAETYCFPEVQAPTFCIQEAQVQQVKGQQDPILHLMTVTAPCRQLKAVCTMGITLLSQSPEPWLLTFRHQALPQEEDMKEYNDKDYKLWTPLSCRRLFEQ